MCSHGQLTLDFRGENYACSVSALVIYPEQKAEEGRKFLDSVVAKRRFFFDNFFHRILHKPTGDPLTPTADDSRRGYVVFSRDTMQDVYYNDTPHKNEIGRPVSGFGFAGQYEPLTLSVCPLVDLGKVSVAISDLNGPGTISASLVSVGYVSYRLARVSSDGAVYTISPRLILPRAAVEMPESCHAAILAHDSSGRRHEAGPLSRPDHDLARARRAGASAGRISRISRHARCGRCSGRAVFA